MANNPLNQWFYGVCLLLVLSKVGGFPVQVTVLESAVAKGAVCLDGSAPAYHFVKGSGDGINNWIVHLQGGAWCNNVKDCKGRSTGDLGSSKQMLTPAYFKGILSNSTETNPDFYNWNLVKIRYCDGSSFMSDVEEVDPTTNLHFRGARILKVMVEELLSMGMKDADRVVLAGCSAGSLAVILNCDKFKSMIPSNKTKVKCVSDGGYFANIKDITGASRVQSYYDQVVTLHKLEKNLPESCTSKMKAGLCFFPQYIVADIKTPIFFVNPAYDTWQIGANYAPDEVDPTGSWSHCRSDLKNCSADQLKSIQTFSLEFLEAFRAGVTSPSTGFFVNGCYTHCQTDSEDWSGADAPQLNGKTIGNVVGDWVYDRAPPFEVYGSPYPTDKTCNNFVVAPNATKHF